MLKQIGFKRGGLNPLSHPESMEDFMKPYIHRETLFEESREHIPQGIHGAYPPKFPANLWNKDHILTGAFLHQSPIPKYLLNKGYNLYPVFISGVSSHVNSWRHALRSSTLIIDRPPKRFRQNWCTTQATSSYRGT